LPAAFPGATAAWAGLVALAVLSTAAALDVAALDAAALVTAALDAAALVVAPVVTAAPPPHAASRPAAMLLVDTAIRNPRRVTFASDCDGRMTMPISSTYDAAPTSRGHSAPPTGASAPSSEKRPMTASERQRPSPKTNEGLAAER